MKLLIVNHYAVPPTEGGGTRHAAIGAELVRRGHEVVIVASDVPYLTRQRRDGAPEAPSVVPFRYVRTAQYEGNGVKRVLGMVAFAIGAYRLRRQLARPDVVVGSSPHPLAALAAAFMARRWGVPFVLEVRDIWPQTLVDVGRMAPRHPLVWVFRVVERALYRMAQRVVILLPGARTYLEEQGVARDRIILVPNGADLSLYPDPRPAPRADPFRVVYAGAHGVANSLDTVLDAAAQLQQRRVPARFVLVGDGPERQRLLTRAAKQGLSSVEFRDPVPKQQIPGLVADCHAGLLLLKDAAVFRHGVSPNKLFDYMAAGRPVIFGVRAGNDPVADAGCGISIPPEDAGALADAVAALAAMTGEARDTMGARGRRFVEQRHAMPVLAGALEEALLSVWREAAPATAGAVPEAEGRATA